MACEFCETERRRAGGLAEGTRRLRPPAGRQGWELPLEAWPWADSRWSVTWLAERRAGQRPLGLGDEAARRAVRVDGKAAETRLGSSVGL